MELIKLSLKNFKGARDITIEPEGASLSIFGDNGTYKTTLFDALCWLLFDKDSRGRSTNYFSIKTKENGEVIHDIDHEVVGVFSGPEIDSQHITLRKVYAEKWVTRRGNPEPEFDGHSTEYEVDDVPCKMSEYQEAVEKIMPEDLFKILTNPMYFPEELHWSDRRDVLVELAGEIKAEDIISTSDDLLRYPEVLDGKSREDRQKMLKGSRKKLDKKLANIPDRIDQEHKGLYNDIGDVEEAGNTITQLKAKKDTIEAKRSEVKSGGRVADLKVEMNEIEAEKQKAEIQHQQQVQDSLAGQREKVSDLQDKVDEAHSAYRDAKRDYEKVQSHVEQLERVQANVKQDLQDINGREPKPANAFEPDKCPVCEQTMPDAEEHDYEAYLAEFNAEKAEEIKITKEELAQVEQDLSEAKELFKTAESNAANIKGKMNQRQQALEKARAALNEAKQNQAAFDASEFDQQIESINQKITGHRQEKQSQLEKLDKHIQAIESEIESAQSTIHKAKENQRTHERIAELKEEQKAYARELEQVEADLYVIEQFEKAESQYISRRVNDKFEMVEWKLFEQQINGGTKPICEAMVDGIPFGAGLNDGHRIRGGLDIISTLSKHYGKSAPVFVDGAESVTSLPENELQIIALIVHKGLKQMHVEKGLDNHLEVPKQSLAAV